MLLPLPHAAALRAMLTSAFYSYASAALAAPFKVVVSGGTHGNEYTGVYVLQRLALRRAELASELLAGQFKLAKLTWPI